jgi:hypothetical protein
MTTTDTVRVWVTEHDDPEVAYVANDYDDMRGNYEDIGDSSFTFEEYLESWTEVQMPRDVFESDDYAARAAWIEAHS